MKKSDKSTDKGLSNFHIKKLKEKIDEYADKCLMNKTLPDHFHNIGTRLGVSNHHTKTLRDVHISNTSYVTVTHLNTDKKVFRVDPMTQTKVGAPAKEKNSK